MADLPSFEVSSQMRDLAENNIAQARKAFDGFMGAAKRGAETMGGSADLSRTSVQDMYARGFDYAEQNVHAAFEHAQKLARARTPMEAMQIQSEYVRERFAAMQEQAKAFGAMAQAMLKQGAEQTRTAVQQSADEARGMMRHAQEATQQGVQKTEEAVDRTTS
jgi:phasin